MPFLQEAVKRFDLKHPVDGTPLPSVLPRESLPCQPDMEIVAWYETVKEHLWKQEHQQQGQCLPGLGHGP